MVAQPKMAMVMVENRMVMVENQSSFNIHHMARINGDGGDPMADG